VVGGWLEDIEQYAPAQQLLTEYAGKRTAGKLKLAGFLARRQSLAAALDQCEAAWKEPDVVAQDVLDTAVKALGQSAVPARPEDFQRVQSWFDKVRQPRALTREYVMQLADCLDLQGKYSETVALYRDFLARPGVSEKDRAAVSINLVYILAVQEKDVCEALALIDRTILAVGPSPELRDARGLALLANGQSREAVEELLLALADQPTGASYFHLALAHAACHDMPAAKQAFHVATDDYHLSSESIPAIERKRFLDLAGKLRSTPAAATR
jgi:tetratricopeptide (TPR) repeat protein